MVAIIDYNVGNLASVYNACSLCDAKATIVKNPDDVQKFDRVILPGVGAFGDAMEHLIQSGMKEAVIEFAKSGKPIIGICLGMQLLFETSQEFGSHSGLGLIVGDVVKFDKTRMQEDLKIPHMGWNKIFNKENRLFKGLKDPYLYFVHSYYVQTHEQYIIGKTIYGYEFASAVNKENIYGFQPHPEKSHSNGLAILKNFMEI